MSATNNPTEIPAAQELIITRLFDAPRDLVFKVYTEAEHLKHWWGPKGTVLSHCELDLRPGGTFHYATSAPDGSQIWGKLTYQEIKEPELLSYLVSFSDKEGNTVPNPFSPDWPLEVLCEQTFIENDGKTTLTIRCTPHNPTEAHAAAFALGRDGMTTGTQGMLDELEGYLATLQDNG